MISLLADSISMFSGTLAQAGGGGGGGGGGFFLLFQLLLVVVVLAGLWKVFTKAGEQGWLAIIPFVNLWFLVKIAGRPWWFFILLLIPIVGFIVAIILWLDIAKAFGKSVLFALGLIFLSPIFVCILGFGSAQYRGPSPVGM